MHVGIAESIRADLDFTIPVDKGGGAVYFSVNGERFFFNGHNGFFCDSIPEPTEAALRALSRPKRERTRALNSLRRRYGPGFDSVMEELTLFQKGSHPSTDPERRQECFSQRMAPHIVNVYVSQDCNMACAYCFSKGGTFGTAPQRMSTETARHVLAFISEIVCSERHQLVSVNLFGGEPLLASKAVHLLARGLQDLNHRDLKTSIHLLLSTNGTIYNKRVFDIFAERPDRSAVIVSLDADQTTHDQNRPFVGSKKGSSFSKVVRNLKRMHKEGVPYSATCVVPHPFGFVAAAEKLHGLGIRRLEIKQLNRHVYGHSDLPEVFQRDFETWRREYLAYTDYCIDHLGEATSPIHVDRTAISTDYPAKLEQNGANHTTLACGMADVKVAIAADGKIMPCESILGHPDFALGDVRAGFDPGKYDRFKDWLLSKGQHRVDHERCRDCFAKRICGGGCYAQSYDKTAGLEPPDESSCMYTREMVKIDLYSLSRLKKRQAEQGTELPASPLDTAAGCGK